MSRHPITYQERRLARRLSLFTTECMPSREKEHSDKQNGPSGTHTVRNLPSAGTDIYPAQSPLGYIPEESSVLATCVEKFLAFRGEGHRTAGPRGCPHLVFRRSELPFSADPKR